MTIRGPVFVAGASGHIGAAIARALIRLNIPVCLHANRHAAKLEALVQDAAPCGTKLATVTADLGEDGAAERAVAHCRSELGDPACLVNAQGSALLGLLTDHDPSVWDRCYRDNLRSAALMLRAVLPGMIRHGSGAIVTLSSMWGVTGASCEAWYSALKAGVHGLTRAMAQEVGPSGIRVNAVAAGYIESPMNASFSEADAKTFAESLPLQRLGTAEDLVPAVLFLLSEEASWITGQVLSVDGGYAIG